MKKIIFILLATMCHYTFANAQRLSKSDVPTEFVGSANDVAKLSNFAAKSLDGDILYREAEVNIDADKPAALVIFLHEAAGRGNDNTKQMQQEGIYSILNFMKNNGINGYFAVPQCPENQYWAVSTDAEPYAEKVMNLIYYYKSEKGVDPSRIYLFGVSMGSTGVWELLNSHPQTFAAALAASGISRGTNALSIANTPIYSTVGEKEGSEKYQIFHAAIHQAQLNGGDAKLDKLKGLNHQDACAKAFTNERLKWVFGHVR